MAETWFATIKAEHLLVTKNSKKDNNSLTETFTNDTSIIIQKATNALNIRERALLVLDLNALCRQEVTLAVNEVILLTPTTKHTNNTT